MTAPANKKVALHTNSAATPSQKEPSGWDPFEVWRTRVLLPRLAETREDKTPAASTKGVQLVRS